MSKAERQASSKEDIKTIFHPKNILKTIASQFPGISAGVEIQNQIDGKRVERRVSALEAGKVHLIAKLQRLEATVVKTPPPTFVEWPLAVGEYMKRNVELAIEHTPPDEPRHEYIQSVANGCLVGDDYVLTCSEALNLAWKVANHKRGKVIALLGMCRYDFEPEPVDPATGLVLCKLTTRNEKSYQRTREIFKQQDVDFFVEPPVKEVPKWTITPWQGQECGFIVPSDSEDSMRLMELTPSDFGTTVISHFRLPKEDALKVFVTAPYGGRIRGYGSAVFSRDATLLGIISGVEKYEYDAGRRAVVKTLLGFPRFTKPKLKPKEEKTPATPST
jgi:hypothetical protein